MLQLAIEDYEKLSRRESRDPELQLERGRAFCAFHSGGVKYRAFYGGPTPEALLDALDALPVGGLVQAEADLVEGGARESAIVLRAVAAAHAAGGERRASSCASTARRSGCAGARTSRRGRCGA